MLIEPPGASNATVNLSANVGPERERISGRCSNLTHGTI